MHVLRHVFNFVGKVEFYGIPKSKISKFKFQIPVT